jgi:dephospho-CoA kinase
MFAGKPVIGIVGGIGSGKSHIARMFGELGCLVIDSDAQVAHAYRMPEVLNTLKDWWGQGVLDGHGGVNRSAIARKIFSDDRERQRLEGLIHPIVSELRVQAMQAVANNPDIVAYVWDTPLLVETGLDRECDAVVFVETPESERLARVTSSRGWTEADWRRREKIQMGLDKKRQIANDMVQNTAGAADVRNQVREVLSRIVAGKIDGGRPEPT